MAVTQFAVAVPAVPPEDGSTPTLKTIKFISQPIKKQPVEAVPGIGSVAGGHLRNNGICTAHMLLGYYLAMEGKVNIHPQTKEVTPAFVDWFRGICYSRPNNTNNCYYALKTWAEHFI